MTDQMIYIAAYDGDPKEWPNLPKMITKDLKNLGIRAQVIPRYHRFRVRFHCEEDLHMAILSGILEPYEVDKKGMRGYLYVKQ
jgi:hypothetical protein